MISAPLRTTTSQTETSPSVKTHGHLALLEWEETLPRITAAAPSTFGPKKKSVMDHCYDGGTAVLMLVSAVALAASLCRF